MWLDKDIMRTVLVEHVFDKTRHKAQLDGWRNVLIWNGKFSLAHTFHSHSRWWLALRLFQLAFTVLTQRR